MTVPPRTRWKQTPPATLSKSLEGLEIGIPPGVLLNNDSAVSINHPWSSKPLPKLPERDSSIYSRESIIDSYIDRGDKDDSAYVQPHRTMPELVEPRPAFKRPRSLSRPSLAGIGAQEKRCSLIFKAFVSEEQYGVGMHLAKANHYFREKKWEIFPELAPQVVARAPPPPPSRSRKWARARKRWQTGSNGYTGSESDGFRLKLKPIRSYVQTLSKKGSSLNMNRNQTETSMPLKHSRRRNSVYSMESSNPSLNDPAEIEQNLAGMCSRLQEVCLWSRPGSSESSLLSTGKQPWQKPAEISTNHHRRFRSKGGDWQSSRPAKQKSPGVRFPKHRRYPSWAEAPQSTKRDPLSPQSSHSIWSRSDYTRIFYQSTHQFFSAIDGAKKKISESRATRRRAELKKHIRIIGPIEQYPDGTVNQWL